MTLKQGLIALFAVLIIALMFPFSYGVRMAIFLVLTSLAVLTVLGGGMHYFISFFQ